MLIETLDRTLQKTLYWHRVDVMAPAIGTLEVNAQQMFAPSVPLKLSMPLKLRVQLSRVSEELTQIAV
jgi:hypothetical protein